MQNKLQIMSPHDIVILLKLCTFPRKVILQNTEEVIQNTWQQNEIAHELGISQSEISKSVNRSKYAGLLDPSGKNVMKLALMEFLQYGIKYVFPVKPGPIVRGVPTAHSASPLNQYFDSNEQFVWPYGKGTARGQSIIPLYASVPQAALFDPRLHELLALVDALRVGRAREKEMAIGDLKNRLLIPKDLNNPYL